MNEQVLFPYKPRKIISAMKQAANIENFSLKTSVHQWIRIYAITENITQHLFSPTLSSYTSISLK